ncbi:RHS repeat-associated core domain-containing protein [Paucibacter sp. O1-1]|nr:RHS repeat-associated core domain-containing protein [Paucibacter sp. O1-1]MDA3824938.1 RHS repeat-associated core domain-containing protein [Paucibacter sp. O1-1]
MATTAADGSLKSETLYDAWGNPVERQGQSANKFAYTGHQADPETGLYYFKARYYDPELGRFISEDPADGQDGKPASYHRYLYAYGNPLVYVDPDGETNKEALGLDDASIEQSMRNDSVVWGATKYAAKSTFYEVWNFASGASSNATMRAWNCATRGRSPRSSTRSRWCWTRPCRWWPIWPAVRWAERWPAPSVAGSPATRRAAWRPRWRRVAPWAARSMPSSRPVRLLNIT